MSTFTSSLFLRILIIFLVFFVMKDALAETSSDTLRVYYLGEVIVTGQRSPTSLTSSLREVNDQTIRQQQIQNIAEAVGITPGAYISIGSRNEMVVHLRGIDQRQIAVLLDGVPIYVPYDGLVDLGQMPVGAVEKITVTQGNASVLYGPNSLGGSINIVTQLPSRSHTRLRLMGGSGDLQLYSLNQSGSFRSFGYLLGLGYNRQDYFPLAEDFSKTEVEDGHERNNSYYKKFDLFCKLTWRPNRNNHTAFSFSYIDNEKNVPPDIYAKRPRFWRFPKWQKWVLNLTSSQIITNSISLKEVLFYDKYDNILDSYDDATYTTQTKKYAFHSTYDDYSVGGNLFVTKTFSKNHVTTFGATYKRDSHREQGNRDLPWEKYKMDSYTVGLEHEWKSSHNISISAGLGLNLLDPIFANGQALREDIATLDGRLGIHYDFSEAWQMTASVGRKTRFPTLKELYSGQSGKNIPNPNLNEESSFNTEIGLAYDWGGGNRMGLTIFDSEITALIVDKKVMVEEEEKDQLQNIGKARHAGLEFSAATFPIRGLALNASYTFLKARNRSHDRTFDKLPYRPEHLVKSEQEYKFPFGLVFSLEENYVSERTYLDQDDVPHSLDGYFLLNLQFRQSVWEYLTFSFSLFNVLDEYYESEYGFPMPGRNFRAGMVVNL
jgi:iron complex outermembrane receptor protein